MRKKCIGDTPVITHRYADDLAPEMDQLRDEVKAKGWYTCEEDVLSYALFPKVAPKFFEYRAAHDLMVNTDNIEMCDMTF